MAILSLDTSLEAERLLVGLWRAASPEKKLQSWQGLQQSAWELLASSLQGNAVTQRRNFCRRWYGEHLSELVTQRKEKIHFVDPLEFAEQVSRDLTKLHRRSIVVGSVGSAFYGEVRQTQDVNLLVELSEADLPALMAELTEEFYLSEVAAREAILRRSSFNLIHFSSAVKIDLFVSKNRPFDQSRFARSRTLRPGLSVASPEDIVLAKLLWFQSSQGVLEKQWRDILGILAAGPDLEAAYLDYWAQELGVLELLQEARQEVEPLL